MLINLNPGATRRDRTGDLLITKFRVSAYSIDPVSGDRRRALATSAWQARIEPDFEPNSAAKFSFAHRPVPVLSIRPSLWIAHHSSSWVDGCNGVAGSARC